MNSAIVFHCNPSMATHMMFILDDSHSWPLKNAGLIPSSHKFPPQRFTSTPSFNTTCVKSLFACWRKCCPKRSQKIWITRRKPIWTRTCPSWPHPCWPWSKARKTPPWWNTNSNWDWEVVVEVHYVQHVIEHQTCLFIINKWNMFCDLYGFCI